MYNVFRDKLGRFATKDKAITFQEVVDNKWRKLEPIKEFEEPEEVYEEHEYFVGFDYQTPRVTSKGQKVYGIKGKHDFKTEFRVSSPVPLTDTELKRVIQSTFKDYAVLTQDGSYEVKSETKRPTREKTNLEVKFTQKIKR